MHAIKGKFQNGQIVLAEKADWPEDTEVVVEPVLSELTMGTREEDWSDSPEAIAEWIRWYETLDAWLTPEEEAEWRAALEAQRAFDKSTFEERARRLEGLFE